MRSKTLLAVTFGGAILIPAVAPALTLADRPTATSAFVLAQATDEKSKDDAKKKGERPSREQPPAKSEAPKAPPAARESTPPAQVPPAQVKDRAQPRAPEAAKSERGPLPVDRGAEKARQDAGEAARRAKQESDAKSATEQKSKADVQRSRTEPKGPEPKSAEPKGAESKSKAVDDRRGTTQQQQIQRPQTDDRRDAGRDRKDDPRDTGRDRKDDPRDAGRDRKAGPRDAGRDPRNDNEIRERARRLDTGSTSRDELSRARIEEGRRVTIDGGSRTLIREGNRVIIRSDDNDRFRMGRNDRRGDPRVERLPNGRTRTVMVYPGGYEIITVTGSRGEVIYRARRDRGGREVVLIREVSRPPLARIDLGPLQLRIPREQYIVDSRRASRQDIYIALSAPPVEPVERVYSLEEVRSFDRIRDKMRRIDVSDITFETDSAMITADQAEALEELASVINDLVDKNPGETFLIEGHTDAVGSDIYNLALSDRRAEAVAVALSEYYDVPPENLVTQGYGEQFLKVPTEEPDRENRRAAVRRVTPLVNQVSN